jgi:membrane-associated protease RseP (regulator of RpoE activity)
VEKGSRADKAGFRAGDVIVKVNGESISDSGDFTHAIHGRKNSTVSVSIIREKKEQTLTLALPERNQSELLDESFEAPEVDAETVIDLSEPGNAESEVARIMPEMEQTLIEVKPDIEEATRAIRNHQQELKKEMRELQRELRDEEIQMQKNHIQKKKARVLWQPEADI